MKKSSDYSQSEEVDAIIDKLKIARQSGVKFFERPHDFPTGVHVLDLSARKESELRQFKHLHQNCFFLASELLTACQLRLLLLLDGYLALAETRNGIPMFAVTRAIMELNGLLIYLSARLGTYQAGDSKDWRSRGEGFFSLLVRARYGSRDSELVKELSSNGFSKSSLEPIHSKDCERALFTAPEFESDARLYGTLNDLIHTNSQGFNFGSPGYFMSDNFSFGQATALLPEATPIIRYQYPAAEKQQAAIDLTADTTYRHTASILKIAEKFPISPFSVSEVFRMTGTTSGAKEVALQQVHNVKTLRAPKSAGRNDPCPCGSGRKFKHCCLN
jgi:hypothetical protein